MSAAGEVNELVAVGEQAGNGASETPDEASTLTSTVGDEVNSIVL